MKANISISADSLSKVYRSKHREVTALKGVSFDLQQGEILGLIGRNGSGKSTLLKVLGQLIKPDSGEAFIQGKLAAVYDIGSGFHPDLSGRENIFIRGELLGLRKAKVSEKLAEIIEFSGLGKAVDDRLKNYSQGMFLRLAFSTLIILEADIILLDEVLHVGDQMFRRKIQSFFSEIKRRRNRSFIIVSHELGFISEVADKLLWLEEGVIQAAGPPMEVMEKYLKFLGGGPNWQQVKVESGAYFSSSALEITDLKIQDRVPGELATVNWEDPVAIQIGYQIKQEHDSFEFIIGVKDMFDHPIILFSEGMDSSYKPSPPAAGNYIAEFIIPGKILDRGNYRIDLRIAQNVEHLVAALPDILSLAIEKSYSGFTKFPVQKKPLIAPDIVWTKKKI